MEFLTGFIDLFIHLDDHLAEIISSYGTWTYAILFLIIFAETGLVVTPFLPGDSLLFAAGAFAALGSLNVWLLAFLLFVAAVLGDAVNYAVGYRLGAKVFANRGSRIFKPAYFEKTQRFYDKYGNKTIVIARFVPIVRTFAPFMAGVGKMTYAHFATYNVVGAALWVGVCVFGGYFFGNLPFVKENFSLVILAIIFVSVIPIALEFVNHWRERRRAS